MAGPDYAVELATKLEEIQFGEFTTNLVQSVFDGLVASMISQAEAYTEILAAVSGTLTEYVNNTKDDISGEEILKFLALYLDKATVEGPPETAISGDEANRLNGALEIVDPNTPSEPTNQVAQANQAKNDPTLLEAVAKRLAANKYTFLKEMVKLGLLRLVVSDGSIETKLNFRTEGRHLDVNTSSSYNSSGFSVRGSLSTGRKISKWVNLSVSADYNRVRVSSASQYSQDYSRATVDIFGRVLINFKSDFQPLNA